MAGMLGALIRQQKNGEAHGGAGPNPSIDSALVSASIPAPRFPAHIAGVPHATEPRIYESKNTLPVPHDPPLILHGEIIPPNSSSAAEPTVRENVARESDFVGASPTPAAPAGLTPSFSLGAFLKATKKAGVQVNVTVTNQQETRPDPLLSIFKNKSQEQSTVEIPAIEAPKTEALESSIEPETETAYVGRIIAAYRLRFERDLHVPYDRIASYRTLNENLLEDWEILIRLNEDEEALLGTPEQRAEWAKQDEFLNQIREIEDDRVLPDSSEDIRSDETPEDDYFDSEISGDDESSVGAVDILSAPSIAAGINFTLDPSQEVAIIGLVKEQFGCLIGAAGTGKTTTLKMLVNTFMYGSAAWGIDPLRLKPVDIRKYHERGADKGKKKKAEESAEGTIIPSIAMVAFTGQATQVLKKNMPKEWHRNVMTIHLLLGFAPVKYERADGTEGTRFEPSYTKTNKMPWDVIIVDETSMVAVELWHQLLDASKPGCRFYFIGDLNQLPPPIGAGILGFALSKWPVFELTVVHRQADDTANRIIDTAHRILNGELPEFDDTAKGPDWRVAGFKLEHSSEVAADQIVRLAYQLSKLTYPGETGPVYDPWRDRIMVAMNGFNPDRPNYVLGQEPLNESLSQIFAGKDSERIIINAKKKIKKFAVGYRVMATKNEPPNIENRVTNGLTGKIIAIERNEKWTGDWDLVGPELQVRKNRQERMRQISEHEEMTIGERADSLGEAIASFRLKAVEGGAKTSEEDSEKQGGPCSHIVTVAFDNGGTREYRLNAQVEQLQIAYASTVHKAQGAEMPLAIVVIHHNQKMMLNRELLYTAVTRASQRVLIMYTDHGMRIALKSQKISGRTLPEKIRQYQELLGEATGRNMFRTVNVRLFQDDSESLLPEGDDQSEDDPDFEPDETDE